MTKASLSIKGFQDLLDQHGSDLETWPESEQAAARLLLSTNEQAQECLDAACALDTLLHDQPKAPAGLVDKILNASGARTKKS